MNPAQEIRLVQITPPQILVNGAGWVCAELDTLGYDYCTLVVQLGTIGADMAALSVTESNDAGQNHVAIPAATLGNALCLNIDGDASAIPVNADDDTFQVFQFDLQHRRRYLQLVATAGAANSYMSAFAILTRAKTKPVTMADMGCNEVIRI